MEEEKEVLEEEIEEVEEKGEAVKFALPEEKVPDEPAIDNNDVIEIVHNGQVHKLTREKIVELAQKGFDYDVKVGPHGKLAQMINSDPELSTVVDDYWKKKVDGGKVESSDLEIKRLDEFDSEEDWLKSNLQSFAERQKALQPKPQPQTRNAADALQMRDPEFFDRVYPHLDKYAEELSVKDYKKVDSDMGALFKFYDYVKEQETMERKVVRSTPSFRAKSGGGEAPKESDIAPAWKMSKADFQKQLDKIKGYG